MANLTIKNVPAKLYGKLKRRAVGNRRSINGEAIMCLEESLHARPQDTTTLVDDLRRFRATMPRLNPTDSELRKARRAGRR